MKTNLLCGLLAVVSASGVAQEIGTNTSDNYASEAFKNIFIEMPDYRELDSGSKLIVTYEGEIPAEMQGAFEHAVKIWEEVLPMTLPIHITVKTGTILGNGNILSRINFNTIECQDINDNTYAYPLSMIKGVVLLEYHEKNSSRFDDYVYDTEIFDKNDITITYNYRLIDQFDFSLDGELSSNKYDFVTVALRDIAIGLGFGTSFTGDVINKRLIMNGGALTPFESLVMKALGTTDPYKAYANATKGSLNLPLNKFSSYAPDTLLLYAPANWSNGNSLRYFIPDDKPISKLLTYDFGKGYIMRDLSGVNWNDLFCDALDWRREPTVGSASGSASSTGTTDDVLPYKGTVTLTFNDNDNARFSKQLSKNSTYQTIEYSSTEIQPIQSPERSSLSITDYCKKYDCFSPDGPVIMGLSLSVMKKDGSWDCVYKVPYSGNETVSVNIEDLVLNFDESEYARGTTGGLRYRLTECKENLYTFNSTCYDYKTKYFTRDFTPQKALIKYTPDIATKSNGLTTLSDDDWFIDVKVGISNLEGTTRVFVEQLDEGEELPFQYEVKDFRKGYFIANLDRECATTLTVICYNDNGYKRSNTIVIPAIGYPTSRISINKTGNTISFDGLTDYNIASENLSYTIKSITSTECLNINHSLDTNQIDVSDLRKGIYVLSLQQGSNQIATFKFAR